MTADTGDRISVATGEGDTSTTWIATLQNPAGACKPSGIPPLELQQLALAMAKLEDELERPVLVADRMILGSIARTLVMEHRVFRRCSERGVSTPAGDVRPTLPEFRALAQLKAQLLGKLRFRRTPKALDDLRDAWRSAAPVGAGAAIAPEAGQDDADAPEATP